MKQSRDSTLHVAIAGRQLVQWDGESRMANAGPLMDKFALAEGSPSPDLRTMLEHAAAKRIHGIRTVLITTRTQTSSGQQDLRKAVQEAATVDAFSGVEVVEADFSQLRSIFEFV
jgi:Asp-tRNA(Asn)/Glu-tRNA(Gln) amidotransferase A subunit family amidase